MRLDPAGTIMLCEPQCVGFEHAPFNAALLHTVQAAYPQVRLLFLGETAHLRAIREVYASCEGWDLTGVEFEECAVPDRQLAGWRRLGPEFSWISHLGREARRSAAGLIVLCSITNTGLIALKTTMLRRPLRAPVIIFFHSLLSHLIGPMPRRPWNRVVHIRIGLSWLYRPELKFIALGEPILQNVTKELPGHVRSWAAMDHPYPWPVPPDGHDPTAATATIKFGFLGVASKGLDIFSRLADELAPGRPQAEFVMVGFDNRPPGAPAFSSHIQGLGGVPLEPAEYQRRAWGITYSVWTARPEQYRIVASGSFLDALAYLKPVIALENEYLKYYFERMGDIGHLCQDYAQMREVTASILDDFPTERYRRQVDNLRRGRRIFDPEHLAGRFREIVRDIVAPEAPGRRRSREDYHD